MGRLARGRGKLSKRCTTTVRAGAWRISDGGLCLRKTVMMTQKARWHGHNLRSPGQRKVAAKRFIRGNKWGNCTRSRRIVENAARRQRAPAPGVWHGGLCLRGREPGFSGVAMPTAGSDLVQIQAGWSCRSRHPRPDNIHAWQFIKSTLGRGNGCDPPLSSDKDGIRSSQPDHRRIWIWISIVGIIGIIRIWIIRRASRNRS
jgi:hypothetical protein